MNSRRSRLRTVLATVMTVLVLVPTAILFGRVWQDNSAQRDSTALEQKGVEYLTALAPLLNALVEGESSALQGVTTPPDTLKPAIAKVSDVDTTLGATLKTTDRWATLQDKIGKLTKVSGSQVTIYNAHAEVVDLTLALYQTVRRNSELNRDPDNDVNNLQQAVAVDMPATVAKSNQLGDLANMASNGSAGKTKAQLVAQVNQGLVAVQDAVGSLTDDLQAAVENTSSTTLSGSLVTTLDSFRRAVESFTRGVNVGGTPNIATISTAQSSLQTALNGLSSTVLKEMDGLLDSRLSTLDYRRTEAIVLVALAVLLVLGALLWPAAARRREAADAPASPAPIGEATRDIVPRNPYDQVPSYGERRERSGAVR